MAVYFDAVGMIYPIKETEKFKAVEYRRFDSGWAKKVLRFNFRTNTGSVTNMEISALYRANEDGTPADDNKKGAVAPFLLLCCRIRPKPSSPAAFP